jgi:hypothetical protein
LIETAESSQCLFGTSLVGANKLLQNPQKMVLAISFVKGTAMRRLLWAMLAAAAVFVVDSNSFAIADETTNDINCYLIYLQVATKPGPQQGAAALGLMYWLGRLDGRTPKLDLESQLLAALPKLTPARFQTESLRCSAEVTDRGRSVTEIGKDMAKRGIR